MNGNLVSNCFCRMMDSLAIADNFSQRTIKNGRAGNSALYGNPNTLLGLSNGFHEPSASPRVSHEHSDSGLGAEQDL